jgi:putative transposase
MPKPVRRQDRGDIHFVTFSCQDRNPYLESDEAKLVLRSTIEQIQKRYIFHVFGYVIMPEHVHLLVSEPEKKPLCTALAVIKRESSRILGPTPFWLPRYYDFNVFTSEKRIEKLRYIHRNPVTRGLVKNPEKYPWSSFRVYAFREEEHPITITRTV